MAIRPLTPLLLLACLLVGLTAYLAFGGPGDGPAGVGYPGDVEAVIEPGGAADPVRGGGSLPVVRVEIQPVARLVERPAAPSCRLLRGSSGDEVVPARVTWVAGSAACSASRERATGLQLVELELMGGERLYRVVRLAGGTDHVDVRFEGPFSYEGRVLGEAGQPIEGASVWLAGRPEVTTDRSGVFRVDGVRSRAGLPLVIRAEGHADHFREVGWPAGSSRPDFHLREGADLIVRLAASLPAGGATTIYVRPCGGGGDGSLGLRHYPFFWPAVAGPRTLGADGSCRLSGLPRGVQFEVVAHHPLVRTEAVTINVRRAVETAVVRGVAGRPVRGHVMGSGGAPAAGVLVTCRRRGGLLAPRKSYGFLLPASAQLAHISHTFTAVDGSFALARDSKPGPQWITVLPAGPLGLENEIRDPGQEFELSFALPVPGPSTGSPALRLISQAAVQLVVERGTSRDAAIELEAGVPYLIRLREPAVLDITVRGQRGEQRYPSLAVPGVVDLGL